ncbi:MAG: hypothetical protein A2X49_07455 [Lentisphaerae bacterium GWF2_52_8]|nr:MAG: hypothetical protein A2X49_07455 [Lentisphaerae bacterium GWF2_52_8]
MKRIRHLFEYYLVISFYHFVRILPLGMLFVIARIAGFPFMILPVYRKVILGNLRAAFPEKSEAEISSLGWESAGNTCLALLEFFWFTKRPDRIGKHVKLEDETVRELFRKRKEEGKGLLIITQHLGNWELAGLSFSHYLDVPFAVVGRTLPNPYLEKIIFSGRSTNNTRVISAKGAVKGMMQSFKEGYFIATLIDQNTRVRDGGVFVNFFGLPVPTSRAPALFAAKLNLPCVFASCTRNGQNYTLELTPFHEDFTSYANDEALIQDVLARSEKYIRKYPEQYVWFYRRFQYIPQDASEELKAKFPSYAELAGPRFYSNLAKKD